jgi:hypothetical protein
MDDLRIQKSDGRWYWTYISRTGQHAGGSCGTLEEVLECLAEADGKPALTGLVGVREGGRWHVQARSGGITTDHILSDIKQLSDAVI